MPSTPPATASALVTLVALALGATGCATVPPAGVGGTPTPVVPRTASAPTSTPGTSGTPGTPTPPRPDTPATSGGPACVPGTGVPNTGSLSEAAARTANELHAAALRCDLAALRARAERDRTSLGFEGQSPAQVFEHEGTDRAAALVRLLTLKPTTLTDGGRPVVQWPATPRTDADWRTLVAAGVYTDAQVSRMRAVGPEYLGWRVGIDATTGRWLYFVVGD